MQDSEGEKDGSNRKGGIKAMGQLSERSLAIVDVVKEIAKEITLGGESMLAAVVAIGAIARQ